MNSDSRILSSDILEMNFISRVLSSDSRHEFYFSNTFVRFSTGILILEYFCPKRRAIDYQVFQTRLFFHVRVRMKKFKSF